MSANPADVIGRVLQLPEQDYRFGEGLLRLRVTRLRPDLNEHHAGQMWVGVEGVELTWDARRLGGRTATVRASALLAQT